MANKEFRVNGIDYMETGKGYYYKVEAGKKIRIKKQDFEDAFEDLCQETNDELDEQVEEWMAEINEAKEVQKKAQQESDKMAEDAVNAVKHMSPEQVVEVVDSVIEKAEKKTKKRKSKDIAFEMQGFTLTAKQVNFIKMIPDDDFYEHGLDSTLWIDCLCDTVADTFSPMAVGAMISTLREKELIYVDIQKVNGKKCKYFGFTPLGKKIAKELGLN